MKAPAVVKVSIGVFIVLCGLFYGLFGTSAKATSNTWESGVSVHDLGTPPVINGGNLECTNTTLQSSYIYGERHVNGRLTYDSGTYEGVGRTYSDVCAVQNEHGLMTSAGLWSKTLDPNKTLPIDSIPYTLTPSPGGSATLFSTLAPTFSFQYSINHNLEHIGYLSTKTYGTGVAARKEKIWKIDSSKLSPFLLYGDNVITRIDQVGFSDNGRYMVAQLARRGFARIDLYTKEMVPFYNVNYTNGVGTALSVSNDGRFVATSRINTSHFFVHDLSGCLDKFSYDSWPLSTGALTTAGCSSTPLYDSVKVVFSTVENINGLRFSPNGASVFALMKYKVGVGSEFKRIRLDASGYMSSAQGYLAMGDSFSSGEGDGEGGVWYEQGTDEQGNINTFAGRNLCHLSRRSYPYLLAVDLGYLSTNTLKPPADGLFHSVACSGAKMHNITGLIGEKQDDGDATDFSITDNQYRYRDEFNLKNWQPGATKQTSFLQDSYTPDNELRSKQNPEIITISIGGNDGGFGQKLLACLLPGTCEFAKNEEVRAQVAIELASEKKNLERTYFKIKQAAPDARIYVIGYPKFVQSSPEPCNSNVHLDNDEATFINFATGYFNQVIKAAAVTAGVVYIDVEDMLVNVNLCSGATDSSMAVNGLTAGNDTALSTVDSGLFKYGLCVVRKCVGSESFHPNQIGHQYYKAAILSGSSNLTVSNPAPASTSTPIPSDYFGVTARSFVDSLNNTPYSPQNYAKMQEIVTGAINFRSPTVSISGLLPNSQVSFEIHSMPASLGAASVGADGSVETNLVIPDSIEPGYHELHVFGVDALGEAIEYYEPIVLGSSETDFDGDGVLNDVDSCPTIVNSFVDIDEDSVDDACDDSVVILVVESPVVEEEPPDDGPAEFVDKGTPNPETVAGDENEGTVENVLGANTTTNDTGGALSGVKLAEFADQRAISTAIVASKEQATQSLNVLGIDTILANTTVDYNAGWVVFIVLLAGIIVLVLVWVARRRDQV